MHLSPEQSIRFNVNALPKTVLMDGEGISRTRHAYRSRNQKNFCSGLIFAGVSAESLGDYNSLLLNKVVDCCGNQGKLLSPNQYKYIIRSICNLDRPKWQKDCENGIRAAGALVQCNPCSDAIRDAAASIVLADYCAKLDNDNYKKFDLASVIGDLICQLKCCGIKCEALPNTRVEVKQEHINTIKDALRGNYTVDSRSLGSNKKNAELTLLSIGKYSGNTTKSELDTVNTVVCAAEKSGKVLTPIEFENEFKSKGVKPNAAGIAINSLILKLSGAPAGAMNLSGVYPVDAPCGPFPYGIDRGTNLDMKTTDMLNMVMNGISGLSGLGEASEWSDFGKELAQGLIKDGIKVVGSVVKENVMEEFQTKTQSDLAKKVSASTGTPASKVTQEQMSQWANNHPEEAANIAANAAKNSGITAEQFAIIKEALAKKNSIDWTKIAIYGGAGLAALIAIGVTVAMLRKKK
jgi:hypothetical protein